VRQHFAGEVLVDVFAEWNILGVAIIGVGERVSLCVGDDRSAQDEPRGSCLSSRVNVDDMTLFSAGVVE
jgi:hypothetical protein